MKKFLLLLSSCAVLFISGGCYASEALIKSDQQYDQFLSLYRHDPRPELLSSLVLYVDAQNLAADPYSSAGLASFFHCAMKKMDDGEQSELMDVALYMERPTAVMLSSALLHPPVKESNSASYLQVDSKLGCFFADGDSEHIIKILEYITDTQSKNSALASRAKRARLMLTIQAQKSRDILSIITHYKSDNSLINIYISELENVQPFSTRQLSLSTSEAHGSLQPTIMLPCIDLTKVENSYTPADLLVSVAECIDEKNYRAAADLYRLAKGYALYDRARIKDPTVATAFKALAFKYVKAMLGTSPEPMVAALQKPLAKSQCDVIVRLGQPNYYPRYMIQHGIQAAEKEDVNLNFLSEEESDSVWNYVINESLRCSLGSD